ncbi:MAG TPA: hypothetical protein VGR13_09370 [Actinomycetota bacterium]|nr:hypothetical protein [Actinomycetota bacterium]
MRRSFLKGALVGGLSGAIVMVSTAGLAGSGIGAVFNLGRTNRVNAQSTLKGSTKARTLQLTNAGSGSALGLSVRAGRAPMKVNSGVKVANLNADRLDGRDSSIFATDYCALVKGHPSSYPPGPCDGFIGAIDTAGSVGTFSSIAIGSDGLPVVSYRDDVSNLDLKVAHCGNVSCSSGNTLIPLDTVGDVGEWTSIAIGVDGLPVTGYYDRTNGNLKVAHCGNASCSSGNSVFAVDTGGNVGLYTSIAIGTDRLPVVSYYDASNADLKVAHCGNRECASGNTLMVIDSSGNVGTFSSIAIGSDGLPVISYFDASNGVLKVAHCGNDSCSSGNVIAAVDTDGVVGESTSITIGVDGLPVVSYYDENNMDLKVAHCGNRACSTANTLTRVDRAGSVGVSTSIAIGVDGLPVIGYRDDTNGDLKFAHCGNRACSSGNSPIALDTAGNVGFQPAVAIGVDGFPVMAYYDLTNGDLKVARPPVA